MRFAGKHEISTLGHTQSQATGAASVRVTLLSNPEQAGPMTFLVYCDQDVYLRQGGSTVEADADDFLLKGDGYVKITVNSAADAYLAALQVSAAGTLRVTANSQKSPADAIS